jgi:c-di-GMP-binding flagellar brake protein YcgR
VHQHHQRGSGGRTQRREAVRVAVTLIVQIAGDSKKEANEMFYLDLFGLSSNAQFTKNRGIGTILNDD